MSWQREWAAYMAMVVAYALLSLPVVLTDHSLNGFWKLAPGIPAIAVWLWVRGRLQRPTSSRSPSKRREPAEG